MEIYKFSLRGDFLRSCDLRVTLGRPLLYILILLCSVLRIRFTVMRIQIRILLVIFMRDPDLDPAFHFDAAITLMRIQIQLISLMRIRIRNTASVYQYHALLQIDGKLLLVIGQKKAPVSLVYRPSPDIHIMETDTIPLVRL